MSDAVEIMAALYSDVITYTPAGGTAKSFKALVHREPPQPEQVGGYQYRVNALTVEFPRDATDGVLTVQAGKDRLRFKQDPSDAEPRDWVIVEIESRDVGMPAIDVAGWFRVIVEGA